MKAIYLKLLEEKNNTLLNKSFLLQNKDHQFRRFMEILNYREEHGEWSKGSSLERYHNQYRTLKTSLSVEMCNELIQRGWFDEFFYTRYDYIKIHLEEMLVDRLRLGHWPKSRIEKNGALYRNYKIGCKTHTMRCLVKFVLSPYGLYDDFINQPSERAKRFEKVIKHCKKMGCFLTQKGYIEAGDANGKFLYAVRRREKLKKIHVKILKKHDMYKKFIKWREVLNESPISKKVKGTK